MPFAAHVLCRLRLLKLKIEGQTIQAEISPKSCKFKIKIRANPGLAKPSFEQPDHVVNIFRGPSMRKLRYVFLTWPNILQLHFIVLRVLYVYTCTRIYHTQFAIAVIGVEPAVKYSFV